MTRHSIRNIIVGSVTLTLLMSSGLSFGSGSQAQASARYSSAMATAQIRLANVQHLKNKLQRIEHSPSHLYNEAANLLGLTENQLIESIKSGKCIAEVAAEKGITEEQLIAKLLASREAKLADAVQSGKLTQDRANQIKARMKEHIQQAIHRKSVKEHDGQKQPGIHKRFHPNLQKLADTIGISKDELAAELKSGKSLREVAEAHGMTKEQLIAKLKENMTPMLDKFVEHKRQMTPDVKSKKSS